jgi:hypothetical protein
MFKRIGLLLVAFVIIGFIGILFSRLGASPAPVIQVPGPPQGGSPPPPTQTGGLTPYDPNLDGSEIFPDGDDPFFVYQMLPDGGGDGMQSCGSQHKVGVNEKVATDFPAIVTSLPHLLDDNGARDVCLVNAGYVPILQFRYWRVLVESAKLLPNGAIEIAVLTSAGADRCGMCCDGSTREIWTVTGGQLQLQSRTFNGGFMSVGRYSITGDL